MGKWRNSLENMGIVILLLIFSQFHREDIRNDIFSIVGGDTDVEIKIF